MNHPLYSAQLAAWTEFRLCYEGGAPYLSGYLGRHTKERAADFTARLGRAIHPNHCRAVVDTYAAHLYRQKIPRTSSTSTLDELWEDMDLLGTPADEFYERAAQLVQRGGRVAVVVDRLDPDGGAALTRAQERAAGRRPYAYAVDTEDIIDWRVDRRGQLVWVAIRERAEDERAPMATTTEEVPERVRIWTRTDWTLVELTKGEDGVSVTTEVARGEHPCGEVPVAFAFWGSRKGVEPVGDSALTDLAPMNRRLTNLVSLIDEQIYQHVFSILAMPRSTWDALEQVNWSVSGALPFHDETTHTPYYLSPDVGQIAAIRAEIDKTESQIRMLSGLGRMNADMGYAVSSGIALSYITMDKDALLSKFGQRMARLEAHVDRLALAWMAETGEAAREYPTGFDPQDLDAELAAAMKFASLKIPGLASREAWAAITRAYLGSRVTPERLDELLQDIMNQPEAPASLGF
jgi:hypothetical protein